MKTTLRVGMGETTLWSTNICRESQHSLGRLQEEFLRLDEKFSQHEIDIPKLQEEVSWSVLMAKSIMAKVDRKMVEFQEWVNYVKHTNVTTGVQREIVDSLNKIILDISPASTMESVSERVEQLEGVIQDNRQNTENVRSAIIQLQYRVDNQSFNSPEMRDQTIYSVGGTGQGSTRSNATFKRKRSCQEGK